MEHYSRTQLEAIAKVGTRFTDEGDSYKCRANGSFWLRCEKNDTAFTPWFTTRRLPTWESWITVWVSQHLANHSIFIDVGANVGYYTMMATMHGIPTIAFEPNPDVMRLLELGLKDNRRQARLETCALSDHDGTAKLLVPVGHSGGSMMSTVGDEGIDIQVARLDSKIKSTDYLAKIDAEGAEPRVWAGMQGVWGSGSECIMEWVPERFDDLEGFVNSIFDGNWVGMINYDGSERQLSKDEVLGLQPDKFETLIVRHV